MRHLQALLGRQVPGTRCQPVRVRTRKHAPVRSLADKRAVARLSKCKPDDAESQAPVWVAKLKESFLRAAGVAPRPAPILPPLLDELDKLAGKDLVKRLALEEKAAQQLALDLEAQEAQVALRAPRWNDLGRLVAYLDGHGEAAAPQAEIKAETQAVLDGRQLLANSDPVPPLTERAANALRLALNAAYASYASQFQTGVEQLRQHPDWGRLLAADQAAILSQVGLAASEPAPAVGTLQARAACARKLEPALQHVNVLSRIVHNATELDTWLTEVHTTALAKLAAGPVQL